MKSSLVKTWAFFLLFAFLVTPAFSQSNLLVGTWRLTAADKILPDGKQVADYGEAPRGIAIFTANGHYAVEIYQTERINNKDSVMKLSCHFGTYSVDEVKGILTFHIDRASHAASDETTNMRPFTLEGDKLAWRVAPRPDGSIPVSVFDRVP